MAHKTILDGIKELESFHDPVPGDAYTVDGAPAFYLGMEPCLSGGLLPVYGFREKFLIGWDVGQLRSTETKAMAKLLGINYCAFAERSTKIKA